MNLSKAESLEIAKFVNRVKSDLDEACYLAIIPNDEGYDIEVEANEGVIAGVFATYSHDIEYAREVADAIDYKLGTSCSIRVFPTRKKWEKYCFLKSEGRV